MQKRKTIEKKPWKSLLAILLIILGYAGQAAPPDWTATPNLQFNMNITSKLQIAEGTFSLNENDLVAGFVNGECRGVGSPMAIHDGLIFLTIGSNSSSGEIISFKAYLADEDMVVELDQTLVFQNGVMVGTAGDPYLFSFDPIQLLPGEIILQAVVAAGGEATGTGGTMSNSSGQTDYLYFSTEEVGSMQFGVQQVFEYFLLFTWTGNQSTVWLLAGNWSFNRTPEPTEETIIIPSGRPRYPILDVLQQVGNLSIEENAMLTIAPNGRLTVTGNLLNEGGTQGLLIRSTADGTGSLLHLTAEVPARVQRHISGHNWVWHQLSSPVAAQSISHGFSDGNVFAWHEPAQTWVSFTNNVAWPTWNDVNYGHGHFIPARGYMTAYIDNPTKLFEGLLNQGIYTFNLQRQAHPDDAYEGFNLVGNPYPSSIDWNSEHGWSGLDHLQSPALWIWNEQEGQYGSYHSGSQGNKGTHGVTRYIAPMQAFWVRANSSEDLGLDDPVRLHTDQDWLKHRESIPGVLRLAVSGDANPWRDELMLEFDHPLGFGGAEKMFSLYPEAPSLYSLVETTPYSISFHEQATEHTIVPIGFRPGAEGLFEISAEGADHFEQIYLVDRQLGFYHDLRQADSYQFTAGTNDDPQRFELRFSPAGATGIDDGTEGLRVHIYSYLKTLYINLSQETARKILELYDLNGRLQLRRELPEGLHFSQLLHLPDGIYLVRLTTSSGVHWQKVFVR